MTRLEVENQDGGLQTGTVTDTHISQLEDKRETVGLTVYRCFRGPAIQKDW